MPFVYFDESGNSGNNLADPQQPVFVLGALIVPEACWQQLESDLESALFQRFPAISDSGAEIHASDLRGSRGMFKGMPVAERVALRDVWLETAYTHPL